MNFYCRSLRACWKIGSWNFCRMWKQSDRSLSLCTCRKSAGRRMKSRWNMCKNSSRFCANPKTSSNITKYVFFLTKITTPRSISRWVILYTFHFPSHRKVTLCKIYGSVDGFASWSWNVLMKLLSFIHTCHITGKETIKKVILRWRRRSHTLKREWRLASTLTV